MFDFLVFFAINKEIQKEPKVIRGKTLTDAYVNAMLVLPDDAEITDIIIKGDNYVV